MYTKNLRQGCGITQPQPAQAVQLWFGRLANHYASARWKQSRGRHPSRQNQSAPLPFGRGAALSFQGPYRLERPHYGVCCWVLNLPSQVRSRLMGSALAEAYRVTCRRLRPY